MLLEFLAEGGGIAILDVNPGLVIWTFIIFFIVMFILRKFAWNPIAEALDARAQKIHDDIDRADGLRKEAEQKLEEYLQKLNGLRAEGQEIVTEARKDAEDLKNEILSSARKEAEELKNRALREVSLARDSALDDIHRQVTELSIAVAGQILERSLKPEDHQKMISDTITKIKSMN
jgi:F-type H+-transporting ATPase subunit b